MIPVRLNEEWSRRLALMPETSMGSQHVDVILKKGRVIKNVVIFNAEEEIFRAVEGRRQGKAFQSRK